MSKLFETTAIKGITLTNRFIRSATWEGMANDDGSCTPRLIKTMVRLTQGGVGLIITGHAYVRRDGQGDTRKVTCLSDNLCFKPTREGKGLYCVAEEKLRG